MENKIGVRWLQLVVGFLVLMFAGIIYAWSILAGPLVSEFGWSSAQAGLNFTITLGIFCIGGFISGLLSKKMSPMVRMLISAVLIFFSFFFTSRMQGNIAVLYLSYGLLGGMAIGVVYNTIIGTVSAWFPDKRGLASGLLLMGFGLNALIIGKIAANMIKDPTIGWRPTFLWIAIVTAAVFVIASFIIKAPPEGTILPAPAKKTTKNENDFETRDYSAIEMIKKLSFWKLFIFFWLLASVGGAAFGFAKNIVSDAGGADGFAATMVGVISVSNGLGRIISGFLFDWIGRRRTQFVTSGLAIVAPLTVALGLQSNILAVTVIGTILCGMAYGFAPTGSTAFVGAFFGQKNFSLNLGILNLQLIFTAFASTWAGMIKDATGGFFWTFIILAGMSVVGLFLNASIKRP